MLQGITTRFHPFPQNKTLEMSAYICVGQFCCFNKFLLSVVTGFNKEITCFGLISPIGKTLREKIHDRNKSTKEVRRAC